jgi:hypothetical protein
MADKCIWCDTDDASEYHTVTILGRRFLLCEECFSVTWALMQRLSRIREELGRHGNPMIREAKEQHDGKTH